MSDSNWMMIGTWDFGLKAVKQGGEILEKGGGAADAVEIGIKEVEADLTVNSVGQGGLPNWDGEVELDAAIMSGRDLSLGAVAAVKHFGHPISIARRVMEVSPHSFLAGEGAELFAREQGFAPAILLTDRARHTWQQRRQAALRGEGVEIGHDTIGVIALDQSANLVAGTSTSGTAMKHAGRVGDSPLAGSGLYAENGVGAAVATGLGESIMRGCLSFLVVELMRHGLDPQTACVRAVKRVITRLEAGLRSRREDNRCAALEDRTAGLDLLVPVQKEGRDEIGHLAVLALDERGSYGAAANHPNFTYALTGPGVEAKILRGSVVEV